MKYTKAQRIEIHKDQKALNTLLEKYGKNDVMKYLNKLNEDHNWDKQLGKPMNGNSYLSKDLADDVIKLATLWNRMVKEHIMPYRPAVYNSETTSNDDLMLSDSVNSLKDGTMETIWGKNGKEINYDNSYSIEGIGPMKDGLWDFDRKLNELIKDAEYDGFFTKNIFSLIKNVENNIYYKYDNDEDGYELENKFFRYFVDIKIPLLTEILYPAALGKEISNFTYKSIINRLAKFDITDLD